MGLDARESTPGFKRVAVVLHPEKVVTWARLPLQLPLVRWALRVRRDAA